MSEDDPRVRLRHMLEYATYAQRLVAGRREEELETDVALRLALERTIEIVGEAANHLPRASGSGTLRSHGTRLRA